MVPYTFDDVVANLNAVAPYDWAGFLTERLTSKAAHAPLGGIEAGGYTLVYTEETGAYVDALGAVDGGVDAWWSLGLRSRANGQIGDVLYNSPAFAAGLGPGMRIVAVNGRQFSPGVLTAAIKGTKGGTAPMELIVENTGYYKVLRLNYNGGLRYPHLVKTGTGDSGLDRLLAPR